MTIIGTTNNISENYYRLNKKDTDNPTSQTSSTLPNETPKDDLFPANQLELPSLLADHLGANNNGLLINNFYFPPELTLHILEEIGPIAKKVCRQWKELGEKAHFNPELFTKALHEQRYYDVLELSMQNHLPVTPKIIEILKHINFTIPSANKVQQLLLLKATENLLKKIPTNFKFTNKDNLRNLLAYATMNGMHALMRTMSLFTIPFRFDDPLDTITQTYNNGDIVTASKLMQKFPQLVIQKYPNLTTPRDSINPIIAANAFSKTADQDLPNDVRSDLITRLGRDHTQKGRDFYLFLKQVASKGEKAYLRLVEVTQAFEISELSDAIFSTKSHELMRKALLSIPLDERANLLDMATKYGSKDILELILTTLHSNNPEEVIAPPDHESQSEVLFGLHKYKLQNLIPGAFTQNLHANLLPIMNACVTGDHGTVNQILNDVQDPVEEFGDDYCEMIVKITCYHGHLQILQLLKDKEILGDYKKQALLSACEAGQKAIVSKLLKEPDLILNANETANDDDDDDDDVLSTCISHGHTDCVKLLLADPRIQVLLDNTFDPCYRKGRLDILKKLIKKEMLTISERVSYLSRAFKKLTTAESLPVAQFLLTHPAFESSDFSENFQDNCLFCCQEGRLDLLKMLLNTGLSCDSSLLITEAILFDQPEILDYLLTLFPQPEIDIIDDFKLAASLGCVAQVQRLMEDPRIADYLNTMLPTPRALYEETLTLGEEAILLAAESGHKEVAELLQMHLQIDCHAHPILKCFDSVMQMNQIQIVESKEIEISDEDERKRRRHEKGEDVEAENASTAKEEVRKRRRL